MLRCCCDHPHPPPSQRMVSFAQALFVWSKLEILYTEKTILTVDLQLLQKVPLEVKHKIYFEQPYMDTSLHSVSKDTHHEFRGFPCDPGSRSSVPSRVIFDHGNWNALQSSPIYTLPKKKCNFKHPFKVLSPGTVIQHHWLEPLVRGKALVFYNYCIYIMF